MILPSPFVIYASAGALLIGAAAGWKVRDWRCDAALANALEQAAEQQQEAQDDVETQAGNYEAARTEAYGLGAETERQVRIIYRTMDAPAADCAVPADVVSLLKGRVDYANASATGQPSE